MQTIEINVYGKVQGVWFRKNTQNAAERLGVRGTVKNMDDGSVQIVATAPIDVLDKMVEWSKTGDPPANVDRVTVNKLSLQQFEDFQIIH